MNAWVHDEWMDGWMQGWMHGGMDAGIEQASTGDCFFNITFYDLFTDNTSFVTRKEQYIQGFIACSLHTIGLSLMNKDYYIGQLHNEEKEK